MSNELQKHEQDFYNDLVDVTSEIALLAWSARSQEGFEDIEKSLFDILENLINVEKAILKKASEN